MAHSFFTTVLGTALLFASPLAQAQSNKSETAPPSAPQKPNECSAELGNGGSNSSRPLSDQLSQSKGVICPPAGVDPGISIPPVGGGRTPVIPPPGTPGGDPNIQPK